MRPCDHPNCTAWAGHEGPHSHQLGGTILEEATRITAADRREKYGHPFDDAQRFSQIASAATGLEILPRHLPVIMIALKLSRMFQSPYYRDNMVDIAGYARVLEMIFEEEAVREEIHQKIKEAGE
jgi:hypothetical protein